MELIRLALLTFQPFNFINLFLIIPPLIHPLALYHLQVALIALRSGTSKIGDLQHPFVQVGKADAVYLAFTKVIAKTFVEFHGDVFIIVPVNGGLVSHS